MVPSGLNPDTIFFKISLVLLWSDFLFETNSLSNILFKSTHSNLSSFALMIRGFSVLLTLSPINNSSYNFSPALRPVYYISISPSGKFSSLTLRPLRRISFSANSLIFTGWPISNTKTSPPVPIAPAWIVSSTASVTVMK